MVKVHPEGVIWVTNSSEMFAVVDKNGSVAQKHRNQRERQSAQRLQRISKSIKSQTYVFLTLPEQTKQW